MQAKGDSRTLLRLRFRLRLVDQVTGATSRLGGVGKPGRQRSADN